VSWAVATLAWPAAGMHAVYSDMHGAPGHAVFLRPRVGVALPLVQPGCEERL